MQVPVATRGGIEIESDDKSSHSRKLAGAKIGLRINFNSTKQKDSVKRFVFWLFSFVLFVPFAYYVT